MEESADPERITDLSGTRFDREAVERLYPNARRNLQGGLFISHAGKDYERIRRDLVEPLIHDRFGVNYFFHNRRSGGAESYVELVRAALEYCDRVLVVVSRHSAGHGWVAAEVDWAIHNRRPIIVCLFDDSDPAAVHHALAESSRAIDIVDFRRHKERARQELGSRLGIEPRQKGDEVNAPPTGSN